MTPFDKAFEAVGKLADSFQANEHYFLSPKYQEAEVRKDFIDKFFKALGWDVDHDEQKNPRAQEVKVERGQQQGAARKRADYAFCLAPNYLDVRFFVEAKKPSVEIANADSCFQAIRYGWNSQNLVSVLTDFEQFLVLDCRYKPSIDNATLRVWKKFHYSEYNDPAKFADLYWLFSREAVASGALDAEKLMPHLPKAKGKAVQRGLFKGGWQSIDDSFLEELDQHRDTLARAFKNKNSDLDSETLTEITQRTINRLVFTRFLEDRLIEDRYHIANYGDKGTAWEDFIADSRTLNRIYNGIVFKEHPILDDPDFAPDDRSFADICESLAHVNSPYDFNAIPIHILGSIYERFLGKVIVATDKRAKVEEKPEVRKAGGVYYTPEYIVRYIVKNTVGKLIEDKTPTQISELRFADIACGSGSFLLGVYDCLLDYHEHWYNEHIDESKKVLHRPAMLGSRKDRAKKEEHGDVFEHDGAYHLTLRKRTEILVNNIYGVDIDHQAVEVAQLSLYLKLLENETAASRSEFQMEFHETLLPSLNKNIVCGNSLIGTDILSGELFEPVDEKKLNPMDYRQRFPEIMKRGGFDAVVGNPPYIPIESMADIEKNYYQQNFEELERKYDSSVIFILAAMRLLNVKGLLGYISSITWQTGENYGKLRRTLFEDYGVLILINLPFDVFKDAYVDTGVYILSRSPVKEYALFRFPKKEKAANLEDLKYRYIKRSLVTKPDYKIVLEPTAQQILLRSSDPGLFTSLGAFTESTQGLAASFFKISNECKNDEWYPFANGAQVYRYEITTTDNTFAYMGDHKSLKRFYDAMPKLLIRRVINRQDRLDVMFFDKQMVFKKDINPFVFSDDSWNPKYVLGILNSKLLSYLYINTSSIATKDDFRQTTLAELRRIPIRKTNPRVVSDAKAHKSIVTLVEQLLDSKTKLVSVKIDRDREFYQNKCESLDRQIDSLVYELYGLTQSEIEIVEAAQ